MPPRPGIRPPRKNDRFERFQVDWLRDYQDNVEISIPKISIYVSFILIITQIAQYFNFRNANFERRYPRNDTYLSHLADMFKGGPIYVLIALVSFFFFSCFTGFEQDVAFLLGVLFALDDGLLQFLQNNISACYLFMSILFTIYFGLLLQEEFSNTFSLKWYRNLLLSSLGALVSIFLYPEVTPIIFIVFLYANISISKSSLYNKSGGQTVANFIWAAILLVPAIYLIYPRYPKFDFNLYNVYDAFVLAEWNVGTLIPIFLSIPLILSIRTQRVTSYLLATLAVPTFGIFINCSRNLDTLYIRLLFLRLVGSAVAAIVLGRQKFVFASFVVILISFAFAWIQREKFDPIDIDFV